MSLFASMNVAHTGMNAADTSISVIGNNLANANTVGFKSQRADFETIYARYMSLGSGSSWAYSAGSNPIQYGQGVLTMGTRTDFSQGNIKAGMTKTDMAISGDGFFITQPTLDSTMQYYTRNGVMKLNDQQQLTTSNGQYVMGFTVNDRFEIQTDKLSAVTIAIGRTKIAQATSVAVLEGILNAVGPDSTQGTVLQSQAMTDLSRSSPGSQAAEAGIAARPGVELSQTNAEAVSGTAGGMEEGTYLYRFVYSRTVNGTEEETDYSSPISVTVSSGQSSVLLTNLPTGQIPDAVPPYTNLKIYRAVSPGTGPDAAAPEYHLVESVTAAGAADYTDTSSTAGIAAAETLDLSRLTGSYQYYVTFVDAQGNESRPSSVSNAVNVNGGRVSLSGLPSVDSADNPDNWVARKIYRSVADDPTAFYLVSTVNSVNDPVTLTDGVADTELVNREKMTFEGKGETLPGNDTLLLNLGVYDGQGRYVPLFTEGTLNFTASKGGNDQKPASLAVNGTTTLGDYLKFLQDAMGIRSGGQFPEIPKDQGEIGKTIHGGSAGIFLIDGKITILGNTGAENALGISSSQMQLTDSAGEIHPLGLTWEPLQEAVGEGKSTDLLVFDSLGVPMNVHLTMTLESKSNTETVYRWYADSADNQPAAGNSGAAGTGILRFDSDGKLIGDPSPVITLERTEVASASPMTFEFRMDLGAVAALATDNPSLSMVSQDGAGAGVLYDYNIDEDGIIYGTFTSGAVRPLGMILLAHFANNEGLLQVGDNLYTVGPNSGQAEIGVPGTSVYGKIKENSLEQSNTDIAGELIDMIMASSTYRANAKVVTAANEMFEAVLRIV